MTDEGDGLPENGLKPDGRFAAREFRFVVGLQVSDVYAFIDADSNCPDGVHGWHHKQFQSGKAFVDIYNEMLRSDSPLIWPQRNPEPSALTFFDGDRIKI